MSCDLNFGYFCVMYDTSFSMWLALEGSTPHNSALWLIIGITRNGSKMKHKMSADHRMRHLSMKCELDWVLNIFSA